MKTLARLQQEAAAADILQLLREFKLLFGDAPPHLPTAVMMGMLAGPYYSPHRLQKGDP